MLIWGVHVHVGLARRFLFLAVFRRRVWAIWLGTRGIVVRCQIFIVACRRFCWLGRRRSWLWCRLMRWLRLLPRARFAAHRTSCLPPKAHRQHRTECILVHDDGGDEQRDSPRLLH